MMGRLFDRLTQISPTRRLLCVAILSLIPLPLSIPLSGWLSGAWKADEAEKNGPHIEV